MLGSFVMTLFLPCDSYLSIDPKMLTTFLNDVGNIYFFNFPENKIDNFSMFSGTFRSFRSFELFS